MLIYIVKLNSKKSVFSLKIFNLLVKIPDLHISIPLV